MSLKVLWLVIGIIMLAVSSVVGRIGRVDLFKLAWAFVIAGLVWDTIAPH